MDATTLLVLAGGLALLAGGGELLVRGASKIAALLGVPPLVVGLTVVAGGTSAPELAVSVAAALRGSGEIALGNAVGSNIFNVLLILGVSALITPLAVAQKLIRVDVPIMLASATLLLVLALDGALDRFDGAFLAACFVAYISFCIVEARKGETRAVEKEYEREFGRPKGRDDGRALFLQAALVIAGLVLLVVGSRLMVGASVEIARSLGVSELIIGLTIVAAGTSLPEVVTSIMAAVRGERDIAVGNVVGSNVFNVLAVLGVSGLVSPDPLAVPAQALHFDLPVMLAVSAACMPIFFAGSRISRWEGGIFLFYYVLYTAFLVLAAKSSPHLPQFSRALLGFVIPLTVVTLVVGVVRPRRE